MNPAMMNAVRTRQAARAPGNGLSRRNFIRTAAGAAAAGAAIGSGLWQPRLLQARTLDPVPIPGGSPLLGGAFHIYGPGFPDFDPPDAEPSTITDFNGFVGLAYISGTCTRTNEVTNEQVELPYLFNDMRFMRGVYKATDGRLHQGTFGFV
jgi:TAT (twin-arginine translocation) pathway signal sequence